MIERWAPGGRSPWCCCHFKACPRRANKREDGTTDTSPDKAVAMAALRFSLVTPSGYASRGSKYDRASKFSDVIQVTIIQWITFKYLSNCKKTNACLN